MSFGSCFADHLAHRLHNYYLPHLHNPFGTTYNPVIILEMLKILQNQSNINLDLIWQKNNLSVHPLFHSSIYGTNPQILQENIKKIISDSILHLKQTRIMLITLGTGYVYTHLSGQVVNNCHKQPKDEFTRNIFPYQHTKAEYISFFSDLFSQRKNLQVIFTLSPVRHLRDDPLENSYSKAMLRCLIEDMVNTFDQCHYFPAYEIMMDELRDYRFYKEDMIHPSDLAVKIILSKFFLQWFDQDSQKFLNSLDDFQKMNSHTPHLLSQDDHKLLLQQKWNEMKLKMKWLPESF